MRLDEDVDPSAGRPGREASPAVSYLVLAGRRPGRRHRRDGTPCQDAVAHWRDPAGGRAVLAVADGLGSCPLSEHGSQAAVEAAVAALAAEPSWDRVAVERAMAAARDAVARRAHELGAPLADLATTLQVAAVADGRVVAAMVGDGAVVAADGDGARVLLAPALGGYANEVVPVTSDGWRDALQVAEGPATAVAAFTDGLTRLLLERRDGAWHPFAPFFATFLPAAAAGDDGLVQRLLERDDVDASWDDDKALGVVHAR